MLWGGVIVVSMLLAVYIVGITWQFNVAHPTLTVIESNHYNTWNLPFPAVTICGINQLDYSNSWNLSENMKLPQGTTREDFLHDLPLLSNFFEFGEDTLTSNLTRLQTVFDANNITVSEVMKMLSPSCSKMLSKCMWKGRLVRNCLTIFRDLKTYEGYCCTFNYVGLNSNVLRMIAKEETPVQWEERHVSTCGPKTGLSIVVDSRIEDYFDTFLSSHGLKVLIHNPLTYPDSNAIEMIVSPGYQSYIAVSPIETYATDRLRHTAIQRRHCRFEDEGKTNTMTNYSYNNCIMECRKDFFVKLCGCYPFYFPSLGRRRTCNVTDIPCLSRYKYELYALGTTDDDYDKDYGSDFRNDPHPCNCLPECKMLNYRTQTTTIPFRANMSTSQRKLYEGIDPNNHTVLHVFFVDLVATRYRMDLYYDWLKLMASIGGILGLLLGFSLLNGFELIYFFTFRLFFYIIRTRGRISSASATQIHVTTASDLNTCAVNPRANIITRGMVRNIMNSPVKRKYNTKLS